MNIVSEPFPCSHCKRVIEPERVATIDCSGCPMIPPCRKPVRGEAWPRDDDDDDDGGVVARVPLVEA